MSTITRDVVIRVAVQGVGGFTLPNVAPATAGMDGFTTATNTAQTAVNELSKATVAVTKNTDGLHDAVNEVETATGQAEFSIRQLGEGVLLVARGMALASGASEQSIAPLVRMFAAVHSGIDVMKGAEKVVGSLSVLFPALASAAGPVGVAIGAMTSAVAVFNAVHENHLAKMEREQALIQEISASWQRLIAQRLETVLIEADIATGADRVAMARRAQTLAIIEYNNALKNTLLSEEGRLAILGEADRKRLQAIKATTAALAEQQRAEESGIETKRRALQTATDQLTTEEDRVRGIRVTIGQLKEYQKVELERLISKVERKEPLSRREAEGLAGVGFSNLADKEFDRLGEGDLAKRVEEATGGKSKVPQLEDALRQARQALGVRDGETGDDAVERIMKEFADKKRAEDGRIADIMAAVVRRMDENATRLQKLEENARMGKGRL